MSTINIRTPGSLSGNGGGGNQKSVNFNDDFQSGSGWGMTNALSGGILRHNGTQDKRDFPNYLGMFPFLFKILVLVLVFVFVFLLRASLTKVPGKSIYINSDFFFFFFYL